MSDSIEETVERLLDECPPTYYLNRTIRGGLGPGIITREQWANVFRVSMSVPVPLPDIPIEGVTHIDYSIRYNEGDKVRLKESLINIPSSDWFLVPWNRSDKNIYFPVGCEFQVTNELRTKFGYVLFPGSTYVFNPIFNTCNGKYLRIDTYKLDLVSCNSGDVSQACHCPLPQLMSVGCTCGGR